MEWLSVCALRVASSPPSAPEGQPLWSWLYCCPLPLNSYLNLRKRKKAGRSDCKAGLNTLVSGSYQNMSTLVEF